MAIRAELLGFMAALACSVGNLAEAFLCPALGGGARLMDRPTRVALAAKASFSSGSVITKTSSLSATRGVSMSAVQVREGLERKTVLGIITIIVDSFKNLCGFIYFVSIFRRFFTICSTVV